MKTTVVYHSSDADGLFCREIARKFLPDAELIGWDFGDKPLPSELPIQHQVYVLDLPLDKPFGISGSSAILKAVHGKTIWIDHHASSIASHPTDIPGYRIDGVAACRLAWQWFSVQERHEQTPCCGYQSPLEMPYCVMWNQFNKVVQCHNCGEVALPEGTGKYHDRMLSEPIAVRLAGEYDIFDKRDPDAELFQHGLRSEQLYSTAWDDMLTVGGGGTVVRLLNQGRALQFARDQEYRDVITQQGFDVQFEGRCYLACNSHELDIRSHLFEAGIKPHHDGLLGFTFNGKDWRVSLYGIPGKDIDHSKIAVKHGGGGHKNACGFRAATLPFLC